MSVILPEIETRHRANKIKKVINNKEFNMSTKPFIDIAVGVLKRNGLICLSQRQKHQSFADCWEFPGGKVESQETLIKALKREFKEELNITTHNWQPLIEIPWHYEKVSVRLHVFETDEFEGEPQGNEGQKVQWFELAELNNLEFPQANKGIVSALNLPSQYMMNGKYSSVEDALTKIEIALANGIKICQLKNRGLTESEFDELVQKSIFLCHKKQAKLLLNGEANLLKKHPNADGLQISATDIGLYQHRPVAKDKLLGISTHEDEHIQQALKLEADFLLLSPVKPTSAHPDLQAIGWQGFEKMLKALPIPVYALGGMNPEDVNKAKSHGAQGVAAISGFGQVRMKLNRVVLS